MESAFSILDGVGIGGKTVMSLRLKVALGVFRQPLKADDLQS